jgi:ABC-type multidrug transport system fused ATPase/permease subunit
MAPKNSMTTTPNISLPSFTLRFCLWLSSHSPLHRLAKRPYHAAHCSFDPVFYVADRNLGKNLTNKQWQEMSAMSAHFLDALQGIKTLKIFNRNRAEAKKWLR